jgi:hypothetical protein
VNPLPLRIFTSYSALRQEFDRRLRESDLRRAEMERIFAEAKLEERSLGPAEADDAADIGQN